jgi:hypothetical protein
VFHGSWPLPHLKLPSHIATPPQHTHTHTHTHFGTHACARVNPPPPTPRTHSIHDRSSTDSRLSLNFRQGSSPKRAFSDSARIRCRLPQLWPGSSCAGVATGVSICGTSSHVRQLQQHWGWRNNCCCTRSNSGGNFDLPIGCWRQDVCLQWSEDAVAVAPPVRCFGHRPGRSSDDGWSVVDG